MSPVKKIDDSLIRKNAEKEGKPIIEYIMDRLQILSHKENTGFTLFAACPNSYNVLVAGIRSAKRANAPLLYAATLNQVDTDGGYTGWTQNDLIKIIRQESDKIGYQGPNIVGVDHGGPWAKDLQTIEKWDLEKSMAWIKKSFEAAVAAGYDLIHVDPTIDIFSRNISIQTVANRTLELIAHTEKYRINNSKPPLSYEVGTEEVHGGLADLNTFRKFLELLSQGLKEKNLAYMWPIFIVAKVGTDLHTTEFDPAVAKRVSKIAKEYGSYIKGHYTDFVQNLNQYPSAGIGAANVGPEFIVAEYQAYKELEAIEQKLYQQGKITHTSNLNLGLQKAVLDSGRWKKWMQEDEKDFQSLSPQRKDWIVMTSSRYILAQPQIQYSINRLYKNLQSNGLSPREHIWSKIEAVMDKYFKEFNLIGLNQKILDMP